MGSLLLFPITLSVLRAKQQQAGHTFWTEPGRENALESITTNKASGGDGIPVELFQILKDDAVKVRHSICQQTWNSAVATGLEKLSFHSNPKERQCQTMLKLPHNCTHLTR